MPRGMRRRPTRAGNITKYYFTIVRLFCKVPRPPVRDMRAEKAGARHRSAEAGTGQSAPDQSARFFFSRYIIAAAEAAQADSSAAHTAAPVSSPVRGA